MPRGSKVSPEENLLDKPAESLISTKSKMTPEEFENRLHKLSNSVAGAIKVTRKIYSTPIAGAKFCGNIFALIATIFCKTFAEVLFPDIYKRLEIGKKVDDFIKERGQEAHDVIAKDVYKDTVDGLRQILQKGQLAKTPRQIPSTSPAPVEAEQIQAEDPIKTMLAEYKNQDDLMATVQRSFYDNIDDDKSSGHGRGC